MSFIQRLGLWPQADGADTGLIVASTAFATTALLALLRAYLWPTPPRIDRSPLRTVLPRLSQDEFNKLEYKPDNFPGARDVETPVSLYVSFGEARILTVKLSRLSSVWLYPRV